MEVVEAETEKVLEAVGLAEPVLVS